MEDNLRLKNHRITVIVPTYNIEDCIGLCLDSLLAQTFKDFTIICIDDASTDDTYAVLQRYSHDDDRVQVFRLSEDCGVSYARNYGVQRANSELITFVDSDDFVSPYYLQTLYEAWCAAGQRNTFVKAQNVRGVRRDLQNVEWRRCTNNEMHNMTSDEAIRELLLDRISVVAWACLAPRELYLKHPFPVGMVFEDHYCIAEHLESVDRVVVVETPIYAYVMRESSLSNPTRHDASYPTDMLNAVGHLLELSRHWKDELQGPLAWACAWRLALAISYCSDVDDKSEVRDGYCLATRYLRAHLPAIIRTWYREKLDDIQMRKILVATASPHLYWKTRALVRSVSELRSMKGNQ